MHKLIRKSQFGDSTSNYLYGYDSTLGNWNSAFLPIDTSGTLQEKSKTSAIKSFFEENPLTANTAAMLFNILGQYAGRNRELDQTASTIGHLGNSLLGGPTIKSTIASGAMGFINGIKPFRTDNLGISKALGNSQIMGALSNVPVFGGYLSLGYGGLSIIDGVGGLTLDKMLNDIYALDARTELSPSYSGSMDTINKALDLSGKKSGFFNGIFGKTKKYNNTIKEGDNYLKFLERLYKKKNLMLARAGDIDKNSVAYNIATNGGFDPRYSYIGRLGLKFPSKGEMNKVRNILLKPTSLVYSEKDFYNDIEEFKSGGSIIPEGALHARKNNMEGAGKDFTHKGIPVMDKEGNQQAEIERNEIIFSLEVTKKLELYAKLGTEEAALKAGKLLVDEIFNNTDDRTGLITELTGEVTKHQQGGTLTFDESLFQENTLEFDESDFEDLEDEEEKIELEELLQK